MINLVLAMTEFNSAQDEFFRVCQAKSYATGRLTIYLCFRGIVRILVVTTMYGDAGGLS